MSTDPLQAGMDALMSAFTNIGEHIIDVRNTAEDLESVVISTIEFLTDTDRIADMATGMGNMLADFADVMSAPEFFSTINDGIDQIIDAMADQLPDISFDFDDFLVDPIIDAINGLLPEGVTLPDISGITEVLGKLSFTMSPTSLVAASALGKPPNPQSPNYSAATSSSGDAATTTTEKLVNPITYMMTEGLSDAQQGAIEGLNGFFNELEHVVEASGFLLTLRDNMEALSDALSAAAGSFDLGLLASHLKIIVGNLASACLDLVMALVDILVAPVSVMVDVIYTLINSANEAFENFFKLLPIDDSYIPKLSTIPMIGIAAPYTLIYKIVTGEAPPRLGASAEQSTNLNTVFAEALSEAVGSAAEAVGSAAGDTKNALKSFFLSDGVRNSDTTIFGAMAIAYCANDLIPVGMAVLSEKNYDDIFNKYTDFFDVLTNTIPFLTDTIEQVRQWQDNDSFDPLEAWTWDTIRKVFWAFLPNAWLLFQKHSSFARSSFMRRHNLTIDTSFYGIWTALFLAATIFHFWYFLKDSRPNGGTKLDIQSYDPLDAMFNFFANAFDFARCYKTRFGFWGANIQHVTDDGVTNIVDTNRLKVTLKFPQVSTATEFCRCTLSTAWEHDPDITSSGWITEYEDDEKTKRYYHDFQVPLDGAQYPFQLPIDVTFNDPIANSADFIVAEIKQALYSKTENGVESGDFSKICVVEEQVLCLGQPEISNVMMTSKNADTDPTGQHRYYAKMGDVIELSFQTNMAVNDPVVRMGVNTLHPISTVTDQSNGNRTRWKATAEPGAVDKSGPVIFSIDCRSKRGDLSAQQVTAVTSGRAVTVDTMAPQLTSVTMLSLLGGSEAAVNETIVLTFEANEEIRTPTVTIAGNTIPRQDVIHVSGNQRWRAVYTVRQNDPAGGVAFRIEFQDRAGNSGAPVSSITSGSGISINPIVSI
jgi:hypothetical protein